jgi:GNAT superfamily N-acetyltransferase
MPDTLTIRPASRADLSAVDALLARSYPRLLAPDYPPSVLVTALPLIARANPALVGSGHYFVAVDAEGAVLAAGGCTPSAPPGRRGRRGVAHVRHVITDHRHVRQGIGRRLMAQVVAHARALDAGLLDCLATRTAEPFYAAIGFATLGPEEIELRPGIGFPAIRMQMRL